MSGHEAPLNNGVAYKTDDVLPFVEDDEVLPFVEDDFGGVIVEMKTPMDPKCFVASLRFSFAQWRLQVCAGDITHIFLFYGEWLIL